MYTARSSTAVAVAIVFSTLPASAPSCPELAAALNAVMRNDEGLRAELSDDDLHPNVKGDQVMAPLAEAAIARALQRR